MMEEAIAESLPSRLTNSYTQTESKLYISVLSKSLQTKSSESHEKLLPAFLGVHCIGIHLFSYSLSIFLLGEDKPPASSKSARLSGNLLLPTRLPPEFGASSKEDAVTHTASTSFASRQMSALPGEERKEATFPSHPSLKHHEPEITSDC